MALDNVHVTVAGGEIHALLGGNGSGKSTLIKVLAGVEKAESGGTITLGGAASTTESWTPRAARTAGIRVVHQDPAVFASMTVADNMAAGRGFSTGFGYRIRRREWHRHTANVLARFAIDADPGDAMSRLRPSTQTMVAIARALQDQDESGASVLILDEPTAALPVGEVERLFSALRGYAAAGQSILFVSHRLPEVLDLCGSVTVLRDGVNVASTRTAGLDEHDLAEMVVGRRLAAVSHQRDGQRGEPLLTVQGLSTGPLSQLDLSVRAGEVLGVAGLLGSGRTTLLRTLFGDVRHTEGSISLAGRPMRLRSPADAIEQGVALVPEDRAGDALFASLDLDANLSATVVDRYWRAGYLRSRRQRRDSRALFDTFGIKAHDVRQNPGSLSGGNQQKVVVARWMRTQPRLLLLDNPSQGVDVGARADIHALIREAAGGGTAAVVVSDDFDELAMLCDRVVVLKNGRFTDQLSGGELTGDGIARAVYAREATARNGATPDSATADPTGRRSS